MNFMLLHVWLGCHVVFSVERVSVDDLHVVARLIRPSCCFSVETLMDLLFHTTTLDVTYVRTR